MMRNYVGIVAAAAAFVLAGCAGHSSLIPGQSVQEASVVRAVSSPAHVFSTQRVSAGVALGSLHRLCSDAAPGHYSCYAIASRYPVNFAREGVRPDAGTCYPSGGQQPICYIPTSLQSAYNIVNRVANGGKGQTVAVVDAYGYPTAKSDLAGYRSTMHQPKLCGTCFEIYNQQGGKTPPASSNQNWEGETALDLDMVSAVCPNCKIVLVEASSDTTFDLEAAVGVAVKKANVVSMSWGAAEGTPTMPLYDNHPGKVLVAAAGDTGAGASQPCSFHGVVCVGGTSLTKSSSARGWNEVVWDDLTENVCSTGPCATGSGCSQYVTKPAWQTDKGCKMRSEADIAAVADPNTGVLIYFGGSCCYISGGTSVAAPLIAGLYGLAGNSKTATPATLWAHGKTQVKSFYDVVKGTNSSAAAGTFICPAAYKYICTAQKVYDGPSGWGTPNGLSAL